MTWAAHHAESERDAGLAEAALRNLDLDAATSLYAKAAAAEELALQSIDPGKTRTRAITAVSVASLWYKANDLPKATAVACRELAAGYLPPFAAKQLQELLQVVWGEQARRRSGIEFSAGEVLVSLSGGQTVTGGAPLDVILAKVDEIGRLFYRTIEFLLQRPHRLRGAPTPDILQQFRPWLFQAPTGSYQFAVRVERPKQLSMFPEAVPGVDQITDCFLNIVRASVDDTEVLAKIVPDAQYRDTFLKLTRNLAPTGKSIGRMEIRSPGMPGQRPIVLVPDSRAAISSCLRKSRPSAAPSAEEEIELRGILRGLQLDRDWLEINALDVEQRTIRVQGLSEVVDDLVGPMVNHIVLVTAVRQRDGNHLFRDIQLED